VSVSEPSYAAYNDELTLLRDLRDSSLFNAITLYTVELERLRRFRDAVAELQECLATEPWGPGGRCPIRESRELAQELRLMLLLVPKEKRP